MEATNGTVSKVVLESGLSTWRLAEVRCVGATFSSSQRRSRRRAQMRLRGARGSWFVLIGIFGLALVLEPVIAAIVLFAWLEESLGPAQVLGGLLVLAGVALAQTARASA